MENNKSPANDGLLRQILYNILEWNKGTSSTGTRKSPSCKTTASQKQAVIKLIKKKERGKGIFKIGNLFTYLT